MQPLRLKVRELRSAILDRAGPLVAVVEDVAGVCDLALLVPPHAHSLGEVIPMGQLEDAGGWARGIGRTATKMVYRELVDCGVLERPLPFELTSYAPSASQVTSFLPVGRGIAAATKFASTFEALGPAAMYLGSPWNGDEADPAGAQLSRLLVDYAFTDEDLAMQTLAYLEDQVNDLQSSLAVLPVRYRAHLWAGDSLVSHGLRRGQSVSSVGTLDHLNLRRARLLAKVASPLFLVRWSELLKCLEDERTTYKNGVVAADFWETCRTLVANLKLYFPSLAFGPRLQRILDRANQD